MHNINSASDVLRKKKQNFAAFSGENSRENRPISRGFSREKSQNSQKNRLISPEISGGNFAKKQSVKNSRFRWVLFWQISPKSINFASIWPALFNVFLTGIIICSFNNSSLEKWANAKAIIIMVIVPSFSQRSWKYFWRISRYFTFFGEFRAISQKYLNFAGPWLREISEARYK